MTELEKAWLAGIIDGEGCIFIAKRKRNNRHSPDYALGLAIRMTHFETIRYIKNITKVGSISKHEYKNNSKNWRPSLRWCACSLEAYDLLLQVESFLITKKYELELVKEFMAIKYKRTYRVPQEILDMREYYFIELKKIHRGIK